MGWISTMTDIKPYISLFDKQGGKRKQFCVGLYVIACVAPFQHEAFAADLWFNPALLSNDGFNVADLSLFEKGVEVPPGRYLVDIYVNDQYIKTSNVDFALDSEKGELVPYFTLDDLMYMGVDVIQQHISPDSIEAKQANSVYAYMPESTFNYSVSKQKLNLSVPQIYLKKTARGYVPPALWNEGINAGMVKYNFSANYLKNKTDDFRSRNYYLSLDSGINIGAWHLRDNSSWTYSDGDRYQSSIGWHHLNTWVERDISGISSRLYLGDTSTSSSIFSSSNFRGVRLSSADEMLPNSLSGYAPTVRGIANSVALVTVMQNGYMIYQTTVQPGPFAIDDFYGGSNGDLTVIIKEQDGSIQQFTVPWSSLPLFQREGGFKYSVSYGKYRSGIDSRQPLFFENEMFWGLPRGVTLYGGAQLSDRYSAVNIGIGKNLGVLGAVSLDITHARSKLSDDSNHTGQSLHFLYNKSLNTFGTNIQLAGYRYSTKGYYTLADTTYKRMAGYIINTQDGSVYYEPDYSAYYNLRYKQKGKFEASISQSINDISSIYFVGTYQNYWGKDGTDKLFQLGYTANYKGVSYSLSYNLNKSAWDNKSNQMASFNVSVPLSIFMPDNSSNNLRDTRFTYDTTTDLDGKTNNSAGIYGELLENRNLSYNLQYGIDKNDDDGSQSMASVSLGYRNSFTNASIGYSRTNNNDNYYYSLSGGAIIHEDGITLSQYLGDTNILVQTPNASNVSLGQGYLSTDYKGYAVVPYASIYRENSVYLSLDSLPNNIAVENPIMRTIPTKGSVSKVVFDTSVGYKSLITLTKDNKPIPFGSSVSVTSGNIKRTSLVGDDGLVYVVGMPNTGQIVARWGNSSSQTCKASYDLSGQDMNAPYVKTQIKCQ